MSLLVGTPNIQSAITGSGIYYNVDTVIITFPRTFVTGDSFGYTLDGTLTTETFATTSDAMLDALVADFVAITGSVAAARVEKYSNPPRIVITGSQIGHEIAFTLPTGTTDLKNSTTVKHAGVQEYGLLITNPFDLLSYVIADSATAGTVYVGLLTADPVNSTVTAISNETALAANDTSYTRETAVFIPSIVIDEDPDRIRRNEAIIAFPSVLITANEYIVTHIAIWDSGTIAAGNLLFTVDVPFPIVRVPEQVLAIPVSSLGIKVL